MPETHSPSTTSDHFQSQSTCPSAGGDRMRVSGPPPYRAGATEGLVAPHIKGCLLGPKMFDRIDCFDVSECGFWYLAETPQNRQTLVVSVRRENDFSYALADVVDCETANVAGIEKFRIECRFRSELPFRQVQILRQLWLLESPSHVEAPLHGNGEFSCDQIF